MKTTRNLLLFLAASLSALSSPRPNYGGVYDQNAYLAQQIWLDSMGAFIGAPFVQIDAPWDGSQFVFGLYVYDPNAGWMIGSKVDSGSAISYNAGTETLTFGVNAATQTALNLKADSSSLSGYATTSALGNYTLTSVLTGQLAAKEPSIMAGTTAQYWRGDKTWQTLPLIPGNVSAFANDSGYVGTSGARSAITLTTTGTSGAASYNSSTGTLNVPNYAAGTGTVTSIGVTSSNLTVSGTPVTTAGNISISLPNTGTAGTYNESVTTDTQGRVTAGTSRTIASSTLTLVTSATGAGGVQLDASRDMEAHYTLATSTTSTIGGPSTVTVYFETADTNSTTAGDWTAVETQVIGQTVTLAVALQVVQPIPVSLNRWIPGGKYVRIRYGVTGTGSCTFGTGQTIKH